MGAFTLPCAVSSQEGPDWIVTVGAVSPPEGGYHLPPADSAAPVRTQRMQTCPGGPTPLPHGIEVP